MYDVFRPCFHPAESQSLRHTGQQIKIFPLRVISIINDSQEMLYFKTQLSLLEW